MDTVEIVAYRQELFDLRQGVLRRTVQFQDPQGRLTRWQEQRLVSMAQPHLAGLAVEVTAENWAGRPDDALCPGRQRDQSGAAALPGLGGWRRPWKWASPTPRPCCCAGPRGPCCTWSKQADPSLSPGPPAQRGATARLPDGCHRHELACPMQPGAFITLEKIVALSTSRDPAIAGRASTPRRPCAEAGRFDDLWPPTRWRGRTSGRACDAVAIEEKQPAATALSCGSFSISCKTVSPHTIEFDIQVPARELAR